MSFLDKNEKQERGDGEKKQTPMLFYALAGALVLVLAFNQLQISAVAGALSEVNLKTAGSQAGVVPQSAGKSSISFDDVVAKVVPKGVPKIYGSELGISYDDPVKALPKLAAYDESIKLAGDDLKRYTKLMLQMSCEYCCGAPSIVFENGQAACGCQHSFAMRGVGKYLVSKHGTEFTDQQILEEVGKWKLLFFPKPVLTKALDFASAGKDLNIADLTSNKYRGFTAESSGSGGADASGLANQVGGC